MVMQGTTDILSLIETDHRKIEELFEEIETANEPGQIQECFDLVYRELTLHSKAEEIVFYPAMRDYQELAEYVEEAKKEHNSVQILLEQMNRLGAESPEFSTKMGYLMEATLNHIEEEEGEMFDALEATMDADKLESLGREFQLAKEQYVEDVEAALARR